MKSDPRLTRLAATLPSTVPFVGPERIERTTDVAFTARLGANELGFGPSPQVIKAMQEATSDVWMYPDPESHDLRAALADHLGIGPDNIMVGEGIDSLLGLLVRLLISEGDAVVTSLGAYPTFNYHVAGFGGDLHMVPYAGDHEDTERLVSKVHETGAKLVYLANPDNPMGSYHMSRDIETMVDALPDSCLLILDEAYIEFVPIEDRPAIFVNDPRVIRMRTFSKAYGMAGARVGYAIGHPELIDAFHKVRNHFGMNRTSQIGAIAALADDDHLEKTVKAVARARARIAAIALDNGLVPLISVTNFVAIDCGKNGAFAKKVVAELGKRGVFVRMPAVSPQDRCIRVSCGPDKDLALFAAALPDALAAAKA